MPAKNFRSNTLFDLANFVSGEAHTPDGKVVLLKGQLLLLQERMGICKIEKIRRVRTRLRLQQQVSGFQNVDNDLDLMALDATQPVFDLNMEALANEITDIEKLIEELKPFCILNHLPFLEAQELIQGEEWKCELIERAKNYCQTLGYIPPDQLKAMKQHPDFVKEILPKVLSMAKTMKSQESNSTTYLFCVELEAIKSIENKTA
jgi:hypothetical protein